jgi:hypothetical protein
MGEFGALSPILKTPSAIVNFYSDGGKKSSSGIAPLDIKQVLSGALDTATYKELVGITGSGVLNFVSVTAQNATSRTIGCKIVMDGVTVFDAVSSAITGADIGILPVGAILGAYVTPLFDSLPFYSSLSIQVKSSLAETDLVKLYYHYHLT